MTSLQIEINTQRENNEKIYKKSGSQCGLTLNSKYLIDE